MSTDSIATKANSLTNDDLAALTAARTTRDQAAFMNAYGAATAAINTHGLAMPKVALILEAQAAVRAEIARDYIAPNQYDALTATWTAVMGPINA